MFLGQYVPDVAALVNQLVSLVSSYALSESVKYRDLLHIPLRPLNPHGFLQESPSVSRFMIWSITRRSGNITQYRFLVLAPQCRKRIYRPRTPISTRRRSLRQVAHRLARQPLPRLSCHERSQAARDRDFRMAQKSTGSSVGFGYASTCGKP